MSFSKAVDTAERVVGLAGKRGKKLRKLPMSRTAVGAERLAAVGVINRAGNGSLAALLVAADRHPRDPLLLIDASALLIDAGKPNEALALLAKAQKLPQRRLALFGISTLAILDTNRSAALFRTGRYVAAAAAGRRALKKSAWLVEARENRAMSLLCLNKEEEAICEFREAAKRPLEKGEERLTCSDARDAKPGDFGYKVTTPRLSRDQLSGAAEQGAGIRRLLQPAQRRGPRALGSRQRRVQQTHPQAPAAEPSTVTPVQ